MERRENTPARQARSLYDEINAFLEKNNVTKVRLIREGYAALLKKEKDGTLYTDLP